MSEPKKLGFLGGTFDPVHLGHLILAQDALEGAGLDQVYLIPAAGNPLKENAPVGSDRERVDLIKLAIEEDARLDLILWELEQPPPSFTWKTVDYLKTIFPEDRLFWIIGSDQVESLDRWARIDYLYSQIEFIILQRPGYPIDEAKLPSGKFHLIPMHQIEISSTDIRKRIENRKPVDFFLPSAVSKRIKFLNLYSA